MFGRKSSTTGGGPLSGSSTAPPTSPPLAPPLPPPSPTPKIVQTGIVTRARIQYSGASLYSRAHFAVVTADPDRKSFGENSSESEGEAQPEIVLFADIIVSTTNGLALIEIGDQLRLTLSKESINWKVFSAELTRSPENERARLSRPTTEAASPLIPRHPIRAPR